MAGELIVTASFVFTKVPPTVAAVGRNISNLPLNVSGSPYQQGLMHVLTTEAVVPLGNVTSQGWAFFYNGDVTNYIQLYMGSGGTPFVRLKPGWPAFVPLDPGAVLYAKANTGTCDMEYYIGSQ